MTHRSHKPAEVQAALARGEQVWRIETQSGDDDVLIGTRDECESDVLDFIGEEGFPPGWELIRVEA